MEIEQRTEEWFAARLGKVTASSEELAKVYQDAIKACGQDQAAQAKVIAAKKARIERAKKEKANG